MDELYRKEEICDPETIGKLREHYAAILGLLGEDPQREGLLKTPERVAKAMLFLTKGYAEDPLQIIRSAMFREEYKQMVLVKDIELYSLCEHHMLPFYGNSFCAYGQKKPEYLLLSCRDKTRLPREGSRCLLIWLPGPLGCHVLKPWHCLKWGK